MTYSITRKDVTEICQKVPVEEAIKNGLHGNTYTCLHEDSDYITAPPVAHNLEPGNSLLEPARVKPGDYLLCSIEDCMLVGPYAMIYLQDETLIGESGCSYNDQHVYNNLKFRMDYDDHNIAAQTGEGPIFRASNHHTANYGHTLTQSLGMMRALDSYSLAPDCLPIGHNFYQAFVDDVYALAGYWNVMNFNGNILYCKQLLFSCMRDISRENFDWVRQKMRRATQHIAICNPAPKRIFLSRKNVRRRIANEEELLPVLKKHGFVVLIPEELSILQQCLLFSQAEIIAGAYGAALCNSVYMNPGNTVVELCGPEWSSDSWFRNFAAAARMQYAKVCGSSYSHNSDAVAGEQHDFTIDPSVLDAVLDQALDV